MTIKVNIYLLMCKFEVERIINRHKIKITAEPSDARVRATALYSCICIALISIDFWSHWKRAMYLHEHRIAVRTLPSLFDVMFSFCVDVFCIFWILISLSLIFGIWMKRKTNEKFVQMILYTRWYNVGFIFTWALVLYIFFVRYVRYNFNQMGLKIHRNENT